MIPANKPRTCSFRLRHTVIVGFDLQRIMEKKAATDVFSQWALKGKDAGMERGHAASVNAMLDLALPNVKSDFLQLT